MSMRCSFIHSTMPMEPKSFSAKAFSSAVRSVSLHRAKAPAFTRAGVLGIVRSTRMLPAIILRRRSTVTPAMMEMTALPSMVLPKPARAGAAYWGLTANTAMSAARPSSSLSLTILQPRAAYFSFILSDISDTYTCLGSRTPAFIAPESIAPPIAPAPRKPIFIMMSS